MKLVRDNYTTIENLEREDDEPSPWDIGTWRNLEQVSDGLPLRCSFRIPPATAEVIPLVVETDQSLKEIPISLPPFRHIVLFFLDFAIVCLYFRIFECLNLIVNVTMT